ncbi:PREDICTED: U-box domain-containing protein 54-like [Camelina sativa]|uniref:RING-type E3 ubiquitin transferase n=1 Tax=Camelina sativa TaxID=90675 RepID=A0ABM0X398_CAMSA|nr:PREDICTED: U-box domain-containing protein 54-like [Camelina sativa]
MGDDIYVAVNQDVRESKSTLSWALKTLQVNKIFLLHVHLPFSLTTSSSGLTQGEIDAIQDSELKTSYRSLYKYRDICIKNRVKEEDVDISVISRYDVGEGIVELIYENNIKKLVMGAAADPHYSRGMGITSRKAEYVLQHAPQSCNMWFICKGKLIETREGSFDLGNPSESFSEFSTSGEKPSKGRRRDEDETESPKEQQPGWIPGNEEAAKKVRIRKEPVNVKSKSNGSEADSSSSPCLPPHEYMCPITLEIMGDPHVAADGFTYEAETFREYLRTTGGKKKSPKTGEPLENHKLIPNHTLRIVIREWLEKHPNYSRD